MIQEQILLGAPLQSSGLAINREAVGTTEPVTAEDSLEKNANDSLVGMAERAKNQFIYYERSWDWDTSTNERNVERANIRPRKPYCWIARIAKFLAIQ